MLHHPGRGVCMLLCLLWLTTSCHALLSGTVTHGLWRPDLQLSPSCLSAVVWPTFIRTNTAICFCVAFP